MNREGPEDPIRLRSPRRPGRGPGQLTVVLVDPEIPPNTGNVARTCVATRTPLILVGRLGFDLSDRHLRRAGLDYWKDLDLDHIPGWEDLVRMAGGRRLVLTSTRGRIRHDRFVFRRDDLLVFGSESRGLGRDRIAGDGPTVRLPTWGPVRSLNLSNAVALVLYEAHRQLGFPGEEENPGPGDRGATDSGLEPGGVS